MTVLPLIKLVAADANILEVDPTKLEKEHDLPQNMQNLIQMCQLFLDVILASVSLCPMYKNKIYKVC